VVEVAVIVASALVLALLIQAFVVKPFYIPSSSMEPTLVQGDRVLINRFLYRFQKPQVGDVIVFHPPSAPEADYIKRVVAVEGDTVGVHGGTLYRNGERQGEPFIKEHPIRGETADRQVPSGTVFVMGDNRNSSGDSRSFGPVPLDSILGEAFSTYWPLSRLKAL